MIVLYDADCGFCRWAMAWAVRRDHHHVLVTVPIQSPLGSELLVDVVPRANVFVQLMSFATTAAVALEVPLPRTC